MRKTSALALVLVVLMLIALAVLLQQSRKESLEPIVGGPAAAPDEPLDLPGAPEARISIENGWDDDVSDSALSEQSASGALQITVKSATGARISGTGVTLYPHRRYSTHDVRTATTDANGDALLSSLAPLAWTVELSLGVSAEVDVIAGLTQELTISLPEDLKVFDGVVLDWEGLPVPAASVWTSTDLAPWFRTQLALTDYLGRFTFASLRTEGPLGASASGYGPSRVAYIESTPRTGIILELPALGASLKGTVTRADGIVCPDATISVGWGCQFTSNGPVPLERVSVCCDQNGTFLIDGLPIGDVDVCAADGRYGNWSGTARLLQGTVNILDIALSPGRSVSGVAIDGHGSPVGGAYVTIASAHPEQMPTDFSDSAGRFKLSNVAIGEVLLTAQSRDAYGERRIQPREEGNVEVVLRAADAISAILAEPSGVRLSAWRADLLAANYSKSTTTDGEGRFAFAAVPNGLYDIEIRKPSGGPVVMRINDVRPSRYDRLLTVDPKSVEPGAIVGRIVSSDGSPFVGRISIALESSRGFQGASEFRTNEEGAFLAQPLAAGVYVVTACPEAPLPSQEVARASVRPGAQFDAGIRRLKRSGTLRLIINAGAESHLNRTVRIVVGGFGGRLVRIQSQIQIEDIVLLPGVHRLRWNWQQEQILRELGDFEVHPGSVTESSVVLMP